MGAHEPATDLDARYSDETAVAMSWEEGRRALEAGETYWLSTVRPDGRPHVTPLLAVWHEDAMYFSTGADERKAKNLETNPHCVLTSGNNAFKEGVDLVVEGDAARVRDEALLHVLADKWTSKYGRDWVFTVRDGAFQHEGGTALVFRVAPTTAFGFGKGSYSQTRWRFD